MKFIYDIYLNFNKKFFDFYDWNKSDEIIHVKKIPIFKVSKETYEDFLKNEVSFSKDFLKLVENKTELFRNNDNRLKYAFLITNGMSIFALKVSDVNEYSSLIVTEELDILEQIYLDIFDLEYKIIKKQKNILLKTRYQLKKEKVLENELNKMLDSKEYSKLKFIYYECFNEKQDDILKIVDKLKKVDTNKIKNYFVL